jgi:hypothetical protein
MGAMLADIAEGVMSTAAHAGLRTTRLEVNLPVDVVWTGGPLFADLPRFITRTPFDARPSRLNIVWERLP